MEFGLLPSSRSLRWRDGWVGESGPLHQDTEEAALRGLTHPLTGMLAACAAFMTPSKRWKLSSMEQFTFFRVKSSEAAPKMLTSLAPAATCQHPGEHLQCPAPGRTGPVAKPFLWQVGWYVIVTGSTAYKYPLGNRLGQARRLRR